MRSLDLLSSLGFLGISLLVWFVGWKWLRARARFERLTGNPRKGEDRDRSADSPWGRGLKTLLDARPVATLLRPKTELDRRRIFRELTRAGFRGKRVVETYLVLRAVLAAAGFFLGTGLHLVIAGISIRPLASGALVAVLALAAPRYFLAWRQRRRQREIRNTLPELLDLLSIAIESGHGVDVALKQAAEDLRRSAPVLSQEIHLYFQQLHAGCERRDALHDLAMRAGVPELNAFVNTLIQAYRFGSSVAQSLREQSRHMRILRRHRAEERARKAAFALVFPLVLFIFPGIFVVLVGPAAILILRDIMSLR